MYRLIFLIIFCTNCAHVLSLNITETVVYRKGEEGIGCYRIPAIVRTKNGTLLAFAEARQHFCQDIQPVNLVLRRSTDNGKTWGPIQTIVNCFNKEISKECDHANPVPVVDYNTGRITLLSVQSPAQHITPRFAFAQFSENDGLHWSKPENLSGIIQKSNYLAYHTGPAHGIQLTRGKHAGRLVVGNYFKNEKGQSMGGLVYSDDGGKTWSIGANDLRQDNMTICELNLFERVDGTIYAAGRNQHGDTGKNSSTDRIFALSTDGGVTFSQNFKTIPTLIAPIIQAAILRVTAKDQGHSENRVIFSSPGDPKKRLHMTIRSSFDEGNTWQTIDEGERITNDPSAYSDMTLLPNEEIGLLYEGGKDSPYDELRFAKFKLD